MVSYSHKVSWDGEKSWMKKNPSYCVLGRDHTPNLPVAKFHRFYMTPPLSTWPQHPVLIRKSLMTNIFSNFQLFVIIGFEFVGLKYHLNTGVLWFQNLTLFYTIAYDTLLCSTIIAIPLISILLFLVSFNYDNVTLESYCKYTFCEYLKEIIQQSKDGSLLHRVIAVISTSLFW